MKEEPWVTSKTKFERNKRHTKTKTKQNYRQKEEGTYLSLKWWKFNHLVVTKQCQPW